MNLWLGRGAVVIITSAALLLSCGCEKENTPSGSPKTGDGDTPRPALSERAAEAVNAAAGSAADAVQATGQSVADFTQGAAERVEQTAESAREAAGETLDAAARAAGRLAELVQPEEKVTEPSNPDEQTSPPKEPGADGATLARAHEVLAAARDELENFKQVKPRVPEGMTAIYDVMVIEFEKQVVAVGGQIEQAAAGHAETFNRLDSEIIPRIQNMTAKMREYGRRFSQAQPVKPPATPTRPSSDCPGRRQGMRPG